MDRNPAVDNFSPSPVTVIGMGLSPADLTAEHRRLISAADVLVGGKRHLACFPGFPGTTKEISGRLTEVADFIRERMTRERVVVIASGDPLFYGIGTYLVKTLGAENVRIYPNITSVSAAFARIRESWHDARLISLHGRFDEPALIDALVSSEKIALLTDPEHSPAWLAGFLGRRGVTGFRMCVLEQLGSDSEQIRWFDDVSSLEKMTFSEPNLVILRRQNGFPAPVLYPGMPENVYDHQGGLITKREVRVISLSRLRLTGPDLVLWDLGAGSGSVSVEASLFIRTGRIIAVEKEPERVKQIRNNRARFGVHNMEIVQAVLPEGLEHLPDPDRIFIGGGGKALAKMIRAAVERLSPEGVMVVNTVLLQNLNSALETMTRAGLATEVVQIQVSTDRTMPWGTRLQAQNPVWIVSGLKRSG